MPHSTGIEVPCYFCPFGLGRRDVVNRHCERKHPSGVDIAGERTATGYLFHLLDGHTDRVWATSRDKESPQSIGHCFACHCFIEKGAYKKIEDAVAAHSCKEKKQRAKRLPQYLASAGVGTTTPTTPAGPVVAVDEAFLQSKYKELGKTFEYPYNDDCSVNVVEAVERIFREAFRVEGLLENNRKMAAELTAARSAAPTTTGMDAGTILTMLKSDGTLRAFVTQQEELKREAAANPIVLDDDEEPDVTPYDPFDVIKQLAHDAKRLSGVRKQMDTMRAENASAVIALEGQLAQMKQQTFRLQQELASYQKDLSASQQTYRAQEAELKRLRRRTSS